MASVAGIHVFSERCKAAALGNIATDPHLRGQGLAQAACAKLCLALLESADHIGLNVRSDNTAAIALYQRLGFEVVAEYAEYVVELK